MKARDPYYDNARFLLIFLVVFGHFIQSYIHDDPIIYQLYVTIYTFHMPAFILISGFFAKGFQKKGYVKKVAAKLILPYVIFQMIYTVYYYLLEEQEELVFELFHPQWSLWFLLSLFFWNLLLFLFAKWKPMISLPLAIALGVIVGYFNEIEQFLSLSRTFVFFPFFLLGYYLKKETFENVLKRKSRYFAIGILVLIFLAVSYFPNFNYKWFFGSIPYAFVNTTGMDGGFIRLAVYAVSFAATLSFLALVPRKKYFFTKWGTSSLYVYLLHGFVIKYFRNSELVELFADTEQIIVFSLLSLLLIIFLSSPLMRKMTQPLIECSLTISKHRHYHEKQ